MIKTFCDVCGQEIEIDKEYFPSEKVRYIDCFEMCEKCATGIDFDKYGDEKTAFFKAYCQSHRKAARKSAAKTVPATLEQAIDENAERRLAELDKRRAADKTPCHCRRVKGGRHLVAVCPKPRKPAKTAPLPKTMKEIAAATGATYKQVNAYAYSHGIGTATRTADGHKCRTFTEDEVKAILAHFKK